MWKYYIEIATNFSIHEQILRNGKYDTLNLSF